MRILRDGTTILGALVVLSGVGCGSGNGTGPIIPPVTTGSVAGSVTANGTGVAGAQITLGGATQSTNASGNYTFTGVATGSQSLTLTVPEGFSLAAGETAAKSTTVTAGETSNVSWTLEQESQGGAQEVDVRLLASQFDPGDVTVARGGTVHWINAEAIAHTITPANSSQAGVWQNHSVPATANHTFSHTFHTAGTYNYSCTLHAGMSGVVRVQ